MSRFPRFPLLVVFLVLFAPWVGCDSVEPPPEPAPPPASPVTELLTAGGWQRTSYVFVSGGGDAEVAQSLEFRADGTVRSTFARENGQVRYEIARWTLTPDQSAIVIYQQSPTERDAGRWQILELTASRLVFEADVRQGRIRVTLTR